MCVVPWEGAYTNRLATSSVALPCSDIDCTPIDNRPNIALRVQILKCVDQCALRSNHQVSIVEVSEAVENEQQCNDQFWIPEFQRAVEENEEYGAKEWELDLHCWQDDLIDRHFLSLNCMSSFSSSSSPSLSSLLCVAAAGAAAAKHGR